MNKGMWYAAGAYASWGLFPIYFKHLQHVSVLQVVSHRVLWAFIILAGLILSSGAWKAFRANAFNYRVLRVYAVAALLIGVNWLIYIWAVNTDRIIETSLGYFINPLLNVSLGVLLLRERLRPWQWVAVTVAGVGVLYLTVSCGAFPWIALALALSFGLYGLVKKTAPLGSLQGLTLETGVLLLPAVLFLLYLERTGGAAFLHTSLSSDALLVSSGVLTIIPLLMFASATQRIPLSLLGVLQYIAPTLQFLLGVLVYGEPFTQVQLVGFGIVWMALITFTVEGLFAHRPPPVAAPE